MATIVIRDSNEKELEIGRQKSSEPPSTRKYKNQATEHSSMYERVNLKREGRTMKRVS